MHVSRSESVPPSKVDALGASALDHATADDAFRDGRTMTLQRADAFVRESV